jgi:hypothetical protein
MTADGFTTLLCEAANKVPQVNGVPEDLDDPLRQIAAWVHIDQEGFAASDVRHMILELEVIAATLQRARWGYSTSWRQ